MEIGRSRKDTVLVLTEAAVVGIGLIFLYNLVEMVFGGLVPQWIKLFIAGVIFHIVFEWSGVNLWYALEYCRLV